MSNIKASYFWNPFLTYALASMVVVILYLLDYSDLYPSLDMSVVLFLCFAACTSFLLAYPAANVTRGNKWHFYIRKDCFIFIGLTLGYIIEMLEFGSVPLVTIILGGDFIHMDFGIPTFHVFLIGFSYFYSVYWFDSYLLNKRVLYLFFSLSILFWAILSVTRGGFIILILSFCFCFANRIGLRRYWLTFSVLFLCVIFGFGYLGDLRLDAMGVDSEGLMLTIGGANQRFLDSGLPNTFYWFYLYVSSPLANFQYTVDTTENIFTPFYIGVIADFLPDFISMNIISIDELYSIVSRRITPQLTVGTAYARPYITMGWAGPYLLHLYFLIFFSVSMFFFKKTRYSGAAIGLFCTQGVLMFFDNMLTFAGVMCPVLVGYGLVAFNRFCKILGCAKSSADITT